MPIEIPTVPAGILTLLAFFLPYVQAILQRPGWSATAKRILSIVLALVLTALGMLFYYVMTGEALPSWPVLILTTLGVAQASYGLLTRESATVVEKSVNAGAKE